MATILKKVSIKSLCLTLLSTVSIGATSSPCGMTKKLYLDNDSKVDTISCDEGEEFACKCTFNYSQEKKLTYVLEPKEFSYMGFTKSKMTPKGSFIVEKGYWGYAEHHHFKYEPQYKESFIEKVEYFTDIMNLETGGESKEKSFSRVRWNFDKTNVLIKDEKSNIKRYDNVSLFAMGDLNKDKKDDLVLYLEDKNNSKLLVFLWEKSGYRLVASNSKLAPSYNKLPLPDNMNDEEKLEDLIFLESIEVDRLLTLKFSLINYGTIFRGVDDQYKFQYRHKQMKLIGAERFSYKRATGDGYRESINYLTSKKESYKVQELRKRVGKSTWKKFERSRLLGLEEFEYGVGE